jgi:hypothetical protein
LSAAAGAQEVNAAAEQHPASELLPGTKHLCELPQVWSNCSQGIYLDIGTNVGVQLRKVYDPQQFPNAAVLPIFDRVFGSQRSGVCSVGVEANPHHTEYLEQLNGFFKSRGYQAVVLTETAASIKAGTASFFLDFQSDQQKSDSNPTEWAASLQQGKWHQGQATVPLLDLPSFVMDVVRPILQQEQQTTGELALRTAASVCCTHCLVSQQVGHVLQARHETRNMQQANQLQCAALHVLRVPLVSPATLQCTFLYLLCCCLLSCRAASSCGDEVGC